MCVCVGVCVGVCVHINNINNKPLYYQCDNLFYDKQTDNHSISSYSLYLVKIVISHLSPSINGCF